MNQVLWATCYVILLGLAVAFPVQAQSGRYSDAVYTGSDYKYYAGSYTTGGQTFNDEYSAFALPGSCGGKVEAQFTWNGNTTSASPPVQAVAVQFAQAYWFSYNNVFTCTDGLSDAYHFFPASSGFAGYGPGGVPVNYGIAQGVHYSVVPTDANGNIELYCIQASNSDLQSDADYAAVVYPITINLTGTTQTNGVQEALTGQQIGATLSLTAPGLPYKVSSLTWSTSGGTGPNPIKNWDQNAPGDGNATQIIPLTSTDYSPTNVAAPFNFYDSNPDTVTVKCTGTVTFPDGTSSSFSAVSPTVTFMKPTVTLWNVNTPLAYTTISGFRAGLPNGPFSAQEVWDSMTVTLPPPFNQGNQGQACMAQIINADRAWYRNVRPGPVIILNTVQKNPNAVGTNIVQPPPVSPYPSAYKSLEVIGANNAVSYVINPTALDTGFPYLFGYNGRTGPGVTTGYIWQVGNLGYSGDNPTQPYALNVNDGGGNQWYNSIANDSFTSWMMYQPPGNNSIWVPLQNLTWNWGGVAYLTSDQKWHVTQTPLFFSSAATNTSAYPSWTQTLPVGFGIQP